MSNLVETPAFGSGVYQIETSDPVLGGPGGIANLQAQELANRTAYLKDHVDDLESGATVPTGIATEAYVQAELNKRDGKQSVRVATTANITLSGAQTIDGVAVVAGDRVLVKNQTTGSQNGIYVASNTGWTRAADADQDADVTAGMLVIAAEGTTQADSIWKLTTNDPIVVGTTALTFTDVTAGYAPLNSPAFTGTPTVPTAASGTDNTQAASTEFATRVKNGRASVSVAGGSDVVLTSAQYGVGIIDLSGLLTANINLILPSASGTWVIANKSTGAFNITAKTAAGTGVVVPQGYAIVVYGDGTNVYAASASGQAFLNQQVITGQTGTTITIPGGYTVGAIVIEKNGFWLVPGVDFTATNGSTVVLSLAAVSSDEFLSIAFSSFSVANALPLAGGTLTGALAMSGAAINEAKGANIATAATVNLDNADGNFLHLTGNTGVTAITLAAGRERTVVFDGAPTLTHSANLILPTAANIQAAAGDVAVFRGEGSGVTRCVGYMRANGKTVRAARSWQNMTGSRALATDYTNNTGDEIILAISGTNSAINGTFVAVVGGATFPTSSAATGAGGSVSMQGVVIPDGATYRINNNSGTTTIANWYELRP